MNENRKYIIRIGIVLLGIIFLVKLFFIQVLNTSYRLAAEHNIVQKIIEYPYRGLIRDRNDSLIVYNKPIFDLMLTPKELHNIDTLVFCNLFGITKSEFIKKYKKAKKYSYMKPSIFIKGISNESFAQAQDKMVGFSGFFIQARTVRGYKTNGLANVLGYTGEISNQQLDKDTLNYYRSGDFIGITGLEKFYETILRGKRGVKYKMVNVKGIEKGSFKNGKLDTLSISGENLKLSLNTNLQQYAKSLMQGKIGSVVAIEPNSGEILVFVSSPSYDPSLFTGNNFGKNYTKLTKDSLKPLFNRPLMAMYPPGSIFKTVQALIALQDSVIGPYDQIYCDGTLIGDHAPAGSYNMHKAIMLSSNNYFVKLFRKIVNRNTQNNQFKEVPIGLKNWKKNAQNFGLGRTLGVDLPNERPGFLPGPELYNKEYGIEKWKFSNIISLSIGQGEILMNPIQMANIAAILANRGYYYIPHIVKGIGSTNYIDAKYRKKISVRIDADHFPIIIDGMEDALRGTVQKVSLPDITVCGKTGTAQNPHGADHSIFMAFAPKENPQIAISVFVENAGWGARAAASIASLLIEKHIKGKINRPWLEDYVNKGKFIY